jgi:ubiquinone/menaquinone biosynthesis C-methylase UbiE
MSNPNVSIFSPDKIIKDLQWDALLDASNYANGQLLDVGCGKMPYKSIFDQKVVRYIGLDINNDTADIKGDFLKVKISNESFDTVLCTQVLEHVFDPKKILNKIYRILRSRGVLILTVPFTGSLHEIPNDYFRYTRFALKRMLEDSNFDVIYIKEEGNWISALGQDFIFYLESSFNRYLLKYPKRLFQFIIQLFVRGFSYLPDRIVKSKYSNINYIVVAKKRIE